MSGPETWARDEFYDEGADDDEIDEEDPGAECGRWINGRLGKHCGKAGSEECDFECPYRDSLRF